MNPFKSKALMICIAVAIVLTTVTVHVLQLAKFGVLGMVGALLVGMVYGTIAGRLAAKYELSKNRLPTRRPKA